MPLEAMLNQFLHFITWSMIDFKKSNNHKCSQQLYKHTMLTYRMTANKKINMNDSNKENRFNHQCSLRMRQCRKRNKSISVPLLPYFCRVAFIYSAIIQTSVKFKALLTCDEMLHFCLVLLRFILIMAGIIHGKISKESNRKKNNLPP